MSVRGLRAVLLFILVLASSLAPYIFQLDFSRFVLQDYDILYMSTSFLWLYIITFAILCLLYIRFEDSFSTIVLALMIYLSFNLLYFWAQYPSAPHWDFYYHVGYSKLILDKGKIEPLYYLAYPGAFLLISISSIILNVNNVTTMYVLFTITQILVGVIMLFFTNNLPSKLRLWVFLIIPFFGLGFISFRYFSPYFFTFVLLLLFCVLLLRSNSSHRIKLDIILLILSAIIIVSHPLNSMLLLVMTIFIYAFNKGKIGLGFLLLLSILIIAWHIYNAVLYFDFGISYIFNNIFYGERPLTSTEYTSFTLMQTLVLLKKCTITTLIFTFYKWFMYVFLVVLWCLLTFIKRTDHFIKTLRLFLLGTIITSSIFFFSPISFLERLIHPVLLFIVIIIAHDISKYNRKICASPIKIIILLPIITLPLSFIASHPPYIIYSHHPFEYITFTHEWELSASGFVNIFTSSKATLSTDTHTAMIFRYFAPQSLPLINQISYGENFTSVVMKNPLLFNGTIIIRSFRQEIFSYSAQNLKLDFWKEIDKNLIENNRLIKTYTNGFSSIFFNN